MPFMKFQEIIDQLEHVDDHDVLDKAQNHPALKYALEMSRPPNWRGTGIKPELLLAIAREDGIPVVWVTPPHVLLELVDATKSERLHVLGSHEKEIRPHCRVILAECDDPWIRDDQILLGRAIDAFESGHHEASMSLAVVLGEPLAIWASEPRVHIFDSSAEMEAWEKTRGKKKYKLAKMELAAIAPSRALNRLEILRHALIGPIPKFFTPFFPRRGDPEPETVSRHATVHQPTVSHFSRENALLAIMLSLSILREQQSWSEEVRATDSQHEE